MRDRIIGTAKRRHAHKKKVGQGGGGPLSAPCLVDCYAWAPVDGTMSQLLSCFVGTPEYALYGKKMTLTCPACFRTA